MAKSVVCWSAKVQQLPLAGKLLSDLGIIEHPLPAHAAPALAQLRASTGLKLPDCCVLLAAQDSGAAIATFDKSLARSAQELGLPLAG
jgi:predicted nucleic acid-binding protein